MAAVVSIVDYVPMNTICKEQNLSINGDDDYIATTIDEVIVIAKSDKLDQPLLSIFSRSELVYSYIHDNSDICGQSINCMTLKSW